MTFKLLGCLSGTAAVLDVVSLAADATGREGHSQCARGGATALRAVELVLRADQRSRNDPKIISEVVGL